MLRRAKRGKKLWGKNRYKYPNVFNKKQLIQLFDVIDNPKVMMCCILGFFFGLRFSEMINLKREDIDIEAKRLKVVDGKGGKDRYLPINENLVPIFTKWFEYIGDAVYVIPSNKNNNRKIARKSIRELYAKYLNEADLYQLEVIDSKGKKRHRYSFHTLRHTCATFMLEQGVPIIYIQKFLGHADISTTQIYSHVSDKELIKHVEMAFSKRNGSNFSNVDYGKVISPETKSNPLEVLKLRLAKGEIDLEAYRQILSSLN